MSPWRWRRHEMRRWGARVWSRRLRQRLYGLVVAAVATALLAGAFWVLTLGSFFRFTLVLCSFLLLAIAVGVYMLLTGVWPDDSLVWSQQLPLFHADRLRQVALTILLIAIFLAVLTAFVKLAFVAQAP